MIHLDPGDRYGRLTIIGPAPASDRYPKKRMWHCRCDCGREIERLLDEASEQKLRLTLALLRAA